MHLEKSHHYCLSVSVTTPGMQLSPIHTTSWSAHRCFNGMIWPGVDLTAADAKHLYIHKSLGPHTQHFHCNPALLAIDATRQPVHSKPFSRAWERPAKTEHVPHWIRGPCYLHIHSDKASRRIALCDGSAAEADRKGTQIHRQQRLCGFAGIENCEGCSLQPVDSVLCQPRLVGSPEEGDAEEDVAVPQVHSFHRAAWQQAQRLYSPKQQRMPWGQSAAIFRRYWEVSVAPPVSWHAAGIGNESHSLRAVP